MLKLPSELVIHNTYIEFDNPSGKTFGVAPAGKVRMHANSAGTAVLQSISGSAYGAVGAAPMLLTALVASEVPLTIQAHTSQSADMFVAKAVGNNNGFRVQKGTGDNFYPAAYGDDNDKVFAAHNTSASDAEQFVILQESADTTFRNMRGVTNFNRSGAFETTLNVKATAGQSSSLQLVSGTLGTGQAILRFVEATTSQWQIYKIGSDANLYFRDTVNGRMILTMGQGASAAATLCTFDSRVKTLGRLYMNTPADAPTDGDLSNNSASVWIDEATPAVKMRIRKTDGTYLTLTITNGASPTLA
jgi:hypothetical protein